MIQGRERAGGKWLGRRRGSWDLAPVLDPTPIPGQCRAAPGCSVLLGSAPLISGVIYAIRVTVATHAQNTGLPQKLTKYGSILQGGKTSGFPVIQVA